MTPEAAETGEQSLTVKEAVGILANLTASQVLPVLRHNDFVMVGGLAFAGFRQDAGGYGNPIVRRRLAEEAAKNPAFAKKIQQLAKQPKPADPPILAAPSKTAISIAAASNNLEAEREREKYRAERDRLKSERDAAITAKQGAERILIEAKRDLIAAQSAKIESEKEAERLHQRLERAERKQRQLEATVTALRRASVQQIPSASPLPATPAATPPLPVLDADQNSFADAVRHLLGKQKEALAISIVADVLRTAPEDLDALTIKAEGLIRLDKERDAIPVLRTLIAVQLKRDLFIAAAATLAKILTITPQPNLEAKTVRDFIGALPRCTENLEKVADPLVLLRTTNPTSFELIKNLTPKAWAAQLFPEHSTFDPDAPLPLVLPSLIGMTLTARRLVTAIQRGDLPIVELAQDALKQKDYADRTKILSSVARAADGDTVFEKVLAPKIKRGPVVVDCSNVVWHGQEHNAQQQPRLAYVLTIRRALWQRGYFPVSLIADANFPFVVDDTETARRLVDDDQIQLVIGGSDADEHILREAQRLSSPIVTNDYMVDWDPHQSVIKFQYSFSPDGKPTVYF